MFSFVGYTLNTFRQYIADLNEQSISKDDYDERWVALAEELNKIGPPHRNSYGWRRVWSVFKYNQKRKHPVSESISKRKSRRGNFNYSGIHLTHVS